MNYSHFCSVLVTSDDIPKEAANCPLAVLGGRLVCRDPHEPAGNNKVRLFSRAINPDQNWGTLMRLNNEVSAAVLHVVAALHSTEPHNSPIGPQRQCSGIRIRGSVWEIQILHEWSQQVLVQLW